MISGCGSTDRTGFVLTTWAPLEGNRFRVNSPDTATGRFADRWEAKQTGLLTLGLDTDPATADAAELYLELWGGHPGVANKRFTLNDRTEHLLPEVGAAENHCTYSYPAVELRRDDLRRGANAFQFTCDKGDTFWGHYLIRAAAVRLWVPKDHPRVAAADLRAFTAAVRAEAAEGEAIRLSLDVPPALAGRIAAVEYWGRYDGFDDNGSGRGDDWHGFTKDREPVGIVGVAEAGPPFALTWDTSMLPDQPAVAVRAVVRFKDVPHLTYRTAPAEAALPARDAAVALHSVAEMDRPFWSRAGRVKTARIDLPCDPADIERAELRVIVWDGGDGGVSDHFTLNGHALPVAGGGRHDVLYRILPIDPGILRRGPNAIRLLSSTEHHGLEVLLPGPALIVRTPGPR